MTTGEASRVGKRGTVMLPARLCHVFAIEEGSYIITEEREDGILIRPVPEPPGESYTLERRAEFLLGNATNAEDYAQAIAEVRAMGLDPDHIDHFKPPGV